MQETFQLAGNTAVQAAVALLILKEVFAFVKANRKNGSASKIDAAADLLLQDDPETGAKRWNVKPHAREILGEIDDHEVKEDQRHLRVRGTLDHHTEILTALQISTDLLASNMSSLTEISRDQKNLLKEIKGKVGP